MRRTLASLVISLSVLMGATTSAWAQDFRKEAQNFENGKGGQAYLAGDFETALREWSPLAESGDAWAQVGLGSIYSKGMGVAQDYKEAMKWYRLAAEQGNAQGQYNLGVMYVFGNGVSKNFEKAKKFLQLAAKQGHDTAQYNLGRLYDERRNYKEAMKWYRLAAEQGDAWAQSNVGVMYFFGNGVPKDLIYAHMWGSIGAMNGNETGAKLRDNSSRKMTSSQIAQAQQLAQECVAKKYKGC